MAVTFPLLSTDAVSGSLDSQLTSLLALSGVTVASKVSLAPTSRVSSALFKVTFSTGTSPDVSDGTVTVHVAVLLSCALTVITAVPSLRAVTFPVSSTDTVLEALDFQVTDWLHMFYKRHVRG